MEEDSVIRFAGQDQFGSFVEWLNRRYPASQPVTLAFLPGYDCVADEDGNPRGWAAYDPGDSVIWYPGDPPQVDGLSQDEIQEIMLHILAHEYVHHLQACDGRELDEDEADQRALEMVAEFLAEGGGDEDSDAAGAV